MISLIWENLRPMNNQCLATCLLLTASCACWSPRERILNKLVKLGDKVQALPYIQANNVEAKPHINLDSL